MNTMSKRCKYALKAMVRLAKNYNQGFLSTTIIEQDENIPKKFLEQILLELKRIMLVNRKQGMAGGYCLLKSPGDVSLANIYRIFEGLIVLTPCVSLNFYEAFDDCVDEATCYLRNELIIVREKTRKSMMKPRLLHLYKTAGIFFKFLYPTNLVGFIYLQELISIYNVKYSKNRIQ